MLLNLRGEHRRPRFRCSRCCCGCQGNQSHNSPRVSPTDPPPPHPPHRRTETSPPPPPPNHHPRQRRCCCCYSSSSHRHTYYYFPSFYSPAVPPAARPPPGFRRYPRRRYQTKTPYAVPSRRSMYPSVNYYPSNSGGQRVCAGVSLGGGILTHSLTH